VKGRSLWRNRERRGKGGNEEKKKIIKKDWEIIFKWK
jgi:hypothetical protein